MTERTPATVRPQNIELERLWEAPQAARADTDAPAVWPRKWSGSHWASLGLVLYAVGLVVAAETVWARDGLFYSLGVDWSRFWGATRAFSLSGPRDAYRLDAIARYMQPLGQTVGAAAGLPHVGPAPYPPIFLEMFRPFTLLPPLIGFLLWTAVNLGASCAVAWRLARRFPHPTWRVVLVLALSFPMVTSLFEGQLLGLLVGCLYLGYDALEAGKDLRAGWWLGLLFVKPQYVMVLALVLLLKARWRTLSGLALAGAAIGLASLAVGGTQGIVGYLELMFGNYLHFRGAVAIDPSGMINWRSLLINVFPNLSSSVALAVTIALSLATLATLPIIWRGRWDPNSPRFAPQMLATLVVTVLVAYHSHLHGAALLVIPAALASMQVDTDRRLRWWIWLGLWAPPVVAVGAFLIPTRYELAALALIVTMILTLATIVADQSPGRQRSRVERVARRHGGESRIPATAR